MNIVSAVANLQKELDYYKEVSKDQQGIIKQLIEGPGEVEYIHPFDASELLNGLSVLRIVSVTLGSMGSPCFEVDGKKYKQSPFIPARTLPEAITKHIK